MVPSGLVGYFFQTVADRDPQARFEVITRDVATEVRRQLAGSEKFQSRVNVYSLPSDEVHTAGQKHDLSAMFFTQGMSKLGSSPTRMGEILGCGLPVIANSGVGDVAKVIEEYKVGVLVSDGTQAAMTQALCEFEQLKKDPELATRCRQAAEQVFFLDGGSRAYRELYRQILDS